MSERNISVRYGEAVESFIGFSRSLSDSDWATPVPCTPEWTVRDVLSHVAGIPDDGLNGRTDGAATDPWTASQVERNAEFGVEELLQRWESQYGEFGEGIAAFGEERPPYDCHTHEHDVRHALQRPGNRNSSVVSDGSAALLGTLDVPVALTVTHDDGTKVSAGSAGSDRQVGLATTQFEVFRSRLGRRTPAQVRSLDWTGDDADIDAVVDGWFNFGPSEAEIVE